MLLFGHRKDTYVKERINALRIGKRGPFPPALMGDGCNAFKGHNGVYTPHGTAHEVSPCGVISSVHSSAPFFYVEPKPLLTHSILSPLLLRPPPPPPLNFSPS